MGCGESTLMENHGGLRLALLAALGLLTTAAADAPSGPSGAGVSVASSAELAAAVVMGAPHILITQHLNLRDEQMALTLAVVQIKTRSMRGHCMEEPPAGLVASTATAPLLPRRPGQCLLVNHVLDIGQRNEGSETAPQRLWLHNLYLRRDGGVEVYGTINVKNTGAEAWLTDVTVQGEGLLERGSHGLYLSHDTGGVHAERCTFADLYRRSDGNSIRVTGGTLAAVDTAFRGNIAGGFPDSNPDSAVIYVGKNVIRLENVTFVANKGWDVTVNGSTVPIYSDSAAALSVYNSDVNEELLGYAQPLSAAPRGLFLAPYDPWLFTTQEEACQGEYRPSSGAGDVMKAPCLNVAGFDTLTVASAPFHTSGSGSSTDTSAIVGVSVAGVVLLAAVIAALLVARNRRRCAGARRVAETRVASKPASRTALAVSARAEPPSLSLHGAGGNAQREWSPITHASSESTLLIASTAAVSNISVANGLESLEDALDATRRAGMLLCGRYEVLAATDRRAGGQGCVQFVFDRQTRSECAAKFFFARRHFDHERALYADNTLHTAMTATREVCENEDGAIKAANGAILPPFIVFERGESLDEFQRLQSTASGAHLNGRIDIVTVAQAMLHTAACVAALHRLGWVHRDLKPGNVLRMPRSHTWTLIDFGSAAQIGKEAPIEFTAAYAAPEVVQAYMARLPTVVASPAMDVWALGLIAYELLTGERPFRLGAPKEEIFAVLTGQGRLPWEGSDVDSAAAARLAQLGMFKRGVLQCLERDPAQRPSLASILASWQHVFTATTTAALCSSSAQIVA